MNQTERRDIAIGATRSYIREQGAKPEWVSAEEAWRYLDNLARSEPTLIASEFYLEASENQVRLFWREWSRWQRERGV